MLFYHSGHAEAEGVAVLVARGIFVECFFYHSGHAEAEGVVVLVARGYLWSVVLSFWSC